MVTNRRTDELRVDELSSEDEQQQPSEDEQQPDVESTVDPGRGGGSTSNIWVPAGLSVWVEQDKMQRVISTMGITNPP